jgi:hypothetical protein
LNFPLDDGTYLELMRRALPGDTNGDAHVDVVDLLILVYTFGLCDGDEGYNGNADFNFDGCIDVVDLLKLVYSFGT